MRKKVLVTSIALSLILLFLVFLNLDSFELPHYKSDLPIRNKIYSFYVKEKLSGSFLIAKKGEIIFEGSHGYENFQLKKPLALDTQFNIGSVTKQITGLIAYNSIKARKLNASDPISNYLPEFHNSKFKEIQVKHLIDMTSGLPHNFDLVDFLGPQLTDHQFSSEEFISKLHKYDLKFVPGTEYLYSNLGYVLLAIILERVHQTKFAQLLDKKIFTPLQMTKSLLDTGESDRPDKLASAYIPLFKLRMKLIKMPRWNASMIKGAGGVVSTVRDFFKLQMAFSDLVQSESIFTEYFSSSKKYSFGWEKFSYKYKDKNMDIIAHSGQDPGFISYVMRIPRYDIIAIFFWNIDSNLATLPIRQFYRFFSKLIPEIIEAHIK